MKWNWKLSLGVVVIGFTVGFAFGQARSKLWTRIEGNTMDSYTLRTVHDPAAGVVCYMVTADTNATARASAAISCVRVGGK